MSILKVNTIQDKGGNAIITSDGSGTLTLNNDALKMTPAFQANMVADATISIPNETLTKVTFGTEVFDTDNKYASSRFTPTIAGKYFMYTRLSFNNSTDFDDLRLHFYKNGSRYSGAVMRHEYLDQIYLYDVIELDSDDYVEVYVYQASGAASNLLTNEDGRRNNFGGYRIIGA